MTHRLTEFDARQFQSAIILGKYKNNERKSNGCGKTTIFHGLRYLFFGKTPEEDGKKLAIDCLVRNGCDSCQVVGEVEVKLGLFKITRTRNKKTDKSDLKLEEFINDKWIKKDQLTPTQTQQEIIKLLQCNDECFKHCATFKQSKISGIISSDSLERRNLLKDVLSLGIYSKLERLSKDKTTILNKETQVISQMIKNLGLPSKNLQNLQLEKDNIILLLSNNNNKLQQLIQNLHSQKQLAITLQPINIEDIKQFQDKLKELNYQQDNKILEIDKNNSIIKQLQVSFQQASLSWQKGLDEKKISQQQLDQLNKITYRSIKDVDLEISNLREKEKKGIAAIAKLQQQVEHLQKISLKEGECNQCYQQIDCHHLKTVYQEAQQQINKNQLVIVDYKQRLQALNIKINSLTQEYKNVLNKDNQSNLLNNKIELKNHEIDKYQADIINCQNNLQQRQELLKDLKEKNQERLNIINDLKNKIENITCQNNDKELILCNQTVVALEKEIKFQEDYKLQLHNKLGANSNKLSQKQQDLIDLTEYQKQLKLLDSNLKVRQALTESYKPSGIPTQIIHTILDDWQLQTNQILNQLRPNLQLEFVTTKISQEEELQDSFEIKYYNNNVELQLLQLSGAQKFSFSLALIRGLSLTIQNKLGIEIGILQLDEVDQSLDLESIDFYLQAIKIWQQTTQIFAITHNEYLKDKFTQAILIEGDDIDGSVGKLITL